MKKYTGVLHPYNFEVFRRRLAAAGMLLQADDFHKASGLWSVKLYKADIEMDLRTRNMAGFQLLDDETPAKRHFHPARYCPPDRWQHDVHRRSLQGHR